MPAGVPYRLVALENTADGVGHAERHGGIGASVFDLRAGVLAVARADQRYAAFRLRHTEGAVAVGHQNSAVRASVRRAENIPHSKQIGVKHLVDLLVRHTLQQRVLLFDVLKEQLQRFLADERTVDGGKQRVVAEAVGPLRVDLGNQLLKVGEEFLPRTCQRLVLILLQRRLRLLLDASGFGGADVPCIAQRDLVADLQALCTGKLRIDEQNLVLRLGQPPVKQRQRSDVHQLGRDDGNGVAVLGHTGSRQSCRRSAALRRCRFQRGTQLRLLAVDHQLPFAVALFALELNLRLRRGQDDRQRRRQQKRQHQHDQQQRRLLFPSPQPFPSQMQHCNTPFPFLFLLCLVKL